MAKVTQLAHVIEVDCDGAAEFLDVLSPLTGVFNFGTLPDAHMFRGVCSASFPLLPSAFRDETELLRNGEYIRAPMGTLVDQCLAEVHTLKHFFDVAARHGVRLPEDSPVLRTKLEDWEFLRPSVRAPDNSVLWPPPELYSLIALAQHNGIPTRALDWTTSSLIAAYFATTSADIAQDDQIAVWVVRRHLERLDRILTPSTRQRDLVIFTAPGADNQNLRAQRGMFMLQVHKITDDKDAFTVTPYDKLFASTVKTSRFGTVFKITTHVREAREITTSLASANVTAGMLFPGLAGVAREIREERLLNENIVNPPRTNLSKDVAAQITQLMKMAGA